MQTTTATKLGGTARCSSERHTRTKGGTMLRIGTLVHSLDQRDDPDDFFVVLELLNSMARVALVGDEENYVYRRYPLLVDASTEVAALVREVERED